MEAGFVATAGTTQRERCGINIHERRREVEDVVAVCKAHGGKVFCPVKVG